MTHLHSTNKTYFSMTIYNKKNYYIDSTIEISFKALDELYHRTHKIKKLAVNKLSLFGEFNSSLPLRIILIYYLVSLIQNNSD